MSENPRRLAREIALQAFFQAGYTNSIDTKRIIAYFRQQQEAPENTWSYAQHLIDGTQEHQTEIDQLISSVNDQWSIERMNQVDLNIIRVACFEICYGQEVPPKVAINEAIEIAKKYGTNESSGFINGVLDQVLKRQNT